MMDTWDEARRLAGLLNWCQAPSLAHSFVPEVPMHRLLRRGRPRAISPSAAVSPGLPESSAAGGALEVARGGSPVAEAAGLRAV
jgi:hypothetical protein